MDHMKKIKVAVICHLSNDRIRERLPLKMCVAEKLIRKICGKTTEPFVPDFAVWNTNLIEEIKAYSDKIEMHIIAPYSYLAQDVYEYEENGVFFHFFRGEENDVLRRTMQKLLSFLPAGTYKKNREKIKKLVGEINPDIIHIIGIENPNYAISGLDCPKNIPLMVQLQTLMIDPTFKKNYPISNKEYNHRSSIELQLLQKADYICTSVQHFIDIIKKDVRYHAEFINTDLPLAEPVNIDYNVEKEYDFVYFSANINKAADLAIEAFILASKQIPGITLDVIGGYEQDYKAHIEERLEKNGIRDKVIFEGSLPSHDDVLNQIRKSKFALLPLKIDIVSGTIRESLANGLPVVTTITPGTPELNKEKETLLISPIGDHQALADNMIRLYNNPQLAETLRKNGAQYMTDTFLNKSIVQKWVEAYKSILQLRKNLITDDM